MCGGCPGGTGISRLSAYAAVTGIKSSVGALLQKVAGPRLTIRSFGNHWVVRTRHGHQRVVPGLEEVAAEVASLPLDWDEIGALAGEDIAGEIPHLRCRSDGVLQRIAGSPLVGEQESVLTAAQYTTALLVRAANAGSTPASQ